MAEINTKMKELEEAMTLSTINSRETLRDRERATRDRSRGRNREGEGGANTWKLEKEFKPTTR